MASITYNVANEADLNNSIAAIDAAKGLGNFNDYTINLTTSVLTLVTLATVIDMDSTDTLLIEGNGGSVDGQGLYRPFFVAGGSVTIDRLTIANGAAVGGAGADGFDGAGGGGMGAGGGLFVNRGAVTLTTVSFVNDQARGGAGGTRSTTVKGFGGGGGLGGQGGFGTNIGTPGRYGGGGGGLTAAGGNSPSSPRAASGGKGFSASSVDTPAYQAGTIGAGGGGGRDGPGASGTASFIAGGRGGDFGGGGGDRGFGGFGGGGGGGIGGGGFGGGSGSDIGTTDTLSGGVGGSTGTRFGGNGAGFGGAVFVRSGAALVLGNGTFSGNAANGGDNGDPTRLGAGAGSNLFLMTGAVTVLNPGAGTTLSFAGGIGDDSAASLPTGQSFRSGTAAGAGLVVASGAVAFSGTNTFAGGTTITNGAQVIDTGNLALGPGGIAFGAGGGTLFVGSAVSLTNTIAGLFQGDTIDLRGLVFNPGATATGDGTRVTVISGLNAVTLNLPGIYAPGNLVVQAETPGVRSGSVLTSTVACFADGTRILTDHGEVEVECLRANDRVFTVVGRGFAPIRWIGVRHLDFRIGSTAQRPVIIAAGAFGPGLPARTLRVSPEHALFLDGKLVPARRLVGSHAISIDDRLPAVTYYHLELDRHDVVLADGLPAETWLDTGNRDMFENAGILCEFACDFAPRSTEGCCAPLLVEGADLVKAQSRVQRDADVAPTADVPRQRTFSAT